MTVRLELEGDPEDVRIAVRTLTRAAGNHRCALRVTRGAKPMSRAVPDMAREVFAPFGAGRQPR